MTTNHLFASVFSPKTASILVCLFCLVLHPLQAQFFGYEFKDGKTKVSFPIEIHNHLVIIPVTLEGLVQLNFILDTGVRSTILFERSITDVLGIPYNRTISISGVGQMRQVEALVAYGVSLEIPGIRGYGQSMLVLAEDYLQLRNYLGVEVHGVIGYDLFSRFVIRIDYARKMVTFYHPRLFQPPRRFERIDLDISDTKPYAILPFQFRDSVEFDARFLVDTGASHALLVHSEFDERIMIPERNIASKLGRGLSGDVEGYMARVKGIDIAGYHIEDIVAAFPEAGYYGDSVNILRHGVLGGEMLSRFTVIIDYYRKRMYMKKNYSFRRPFEYNMSGLEFMAQGKDLNKFEVKSVRKGSPGYQAGIQEGDIVVMLNGLDASRLSMSHIFSLMNSRDGRKIRMTIRRKGQVIKKRFVLISEI
ncbi:MAG: aspartyl protease family protein [Cyclobacteriaceae bacterium]|nr:aspartyl protease family protein [Cyclobacteriaceae bacterium]